MMLRIALALLLLSACALQAQTNRVVVNGVPTNMTANWNQVSAVPDPTQPDTFLAVMPISAVSTWAAWEPDAIMDLSFGQGNWGRLILSAVDWAYVTPAACAHLPPVGGSAPLSLLTTDYDYGPYTGAMGQPLFVGASYFVASNQSVVSGLANTFDMERWQLRTRGFFPSDRWNACTGPAGVTPSFAGFIGARFAYSIQ
ncbi:MAG: hypothetical protein VYD05_06430 [Planctomycetota bacterium]|nr:hypothetical protein [Planctomycetota bacterium]